MHIKGLQKIGSPNGFKGEIEDAKRTKRMK